MKLPKTPFTMTEFAAANGLGTLGKAHYDVIRKRFTELGLIQTRRRREKTYAEQVWIKQGDQVDVSDLQNKLKELRIG